MSKKFLVMAIVMASFTLLAACGGPDQAKIDRAKADWESVVDDMAEVIRIFNDLDVDVFGLEQHDELAAEITSVQDRINEMADVIDESGGFGELSDEDLDYISELVPDVRADLGKIMGTLEVY